MAKFALGVVLSAYSVISFFFGLQEWEAQKVYQDACQKKIEIMATQDEKNLAVVGFYGRSMKGLGDIAWKAMRWPEKIVTWTFSPEAIITSARAYDDIETSTGIKLLEDKYCSDLKKR